MRTIIIERSTRTVISDCKKYEDAITKAILRGVANSDMLFVVGSEVIAIHKLAAYMHKEFTELIKCHRLYNTMGIKVDLAPDRRDLWLKIMESREAHSPKGSIRPLSETVGTKLAEDIELLVRLKDNPYGRVLGIDRQETWNMAHYEASRLFRRYQDKKFNVMIHELLGIVVVAPEGFFPSHSGFVTINTYGPRRRQQ